MRKYIKKHIKDEKRIIKLLYRKGFFDILKIDLDMLGWETFLEGKRQRNRKGNHKYKFRESLPQLHLFSRDYWGEWDSESLIYIFEQYIFYEFNDLCPVKGWSPKDNCPRLRNKKDLIKYLCSFKTVKTNNVINEILKITK